MKFRFFLVTLLVVLSVFVLAKEKIVVNSYISDPAPRIVFAELVKMFEEKHPEYDVVVNTFPHEDFKTLLRTWLNSDEAPDVVTWFAGERMRYFASKGLLESMDNIFAPQTFEDYFPASFRSACEYDGKIYFIPQSWYWWGVYYRKSVFEKYGITPPRTWDEFLKVCETLKENGITPITIGTKYLWPAAGWFDYLDLRVNGLDFHLKLTAGEIPYTDSRVKKVFEYWKQLVEKGYFLENHSSYTWQEAAAFLFRGEAGMYLIGQFIKDVAPASVKDDLDFFRFPVINPEIGLYEETPIDGFMIPAKAKNKEGAKVFLRFISEKDIQEYFAAKLGRLAANKNAKPADEHAAKGLKMILESNGVAQFYDRDTNPEMATAGMNGFVEFMIYPEKLDQILENLEKERQRIFGK
ncbi:Extracellular solute-binding protein family 1 [Thermotoga sp. Mc24]|uniref:ABC transporter substrate-binding protein n=1 Tax=Thermotoga sp. Mc24 TaxID=1231241 RepID=UPI000543F24A|nr:ABC transporter substrate-binding protein [Thermotoga sp. Mc24]KHC91507.1 Extracellular solute-binding protein family 1 [Thermotoga sp. Mc24]